MSEEFIKVTHRHTDTQTELLAELLAELKISIEASQCLKMGGAIKR